MEITKDLGMIYEVDKDGSEHNRHYCLFKCPKCGKEVKLLHYRGIKRTMCAYCGKRNNLSHGMSKTKLHSIWGSMKDRCLNPNNPAYKYYGGKGIKVCDKWLHFEGFLEDVKDFYKEGLTIDRIDPNKDYCKENVQWIPLLENCMRAERKTMAVKQFKIVKTSEKTVKYEYIKTYSSLAQAAEECGLNHQGISKVCLKQRKSYRGYYWEYVTPDQLRKKRNS